jgi:outer membrane protein OmpA-like peptidoglycan-associated protein
MAVSLFTANKANLSKSGQRTLRKLQPFVATATIVTVDTYTATGSKARSEVRAAQKLSQQQANTVLRFLLSAKAPTGVKTHAVGHGRTTKFGKSLTANRRTLIHISYLVK